VLAGRPALRPLAAAMLSGRPTLIAPISMFLWEGGTKELTGPAGSSSSASEEASSSEDSSLLLLLSALLQLPPLSVLSLCAGAACKEGGCMSARCVCVCVCTAHIGLIQKKG
jgi:hypothetical protein